jgi:hypothetical protein
MIIGIFAYNPDYGADRAGSEDKVLEAVKQSELVRTR